MMPGDVVVAVNGKPVTDTVDLINLTATIKPGDDGRYTVLRGRDELEITAKAGRRPPIEQQVRRR
jgi:serine protease DegQ